MQKHLVILEVVTDPQQTFAPTVWNWNELLNMGENEWAEVVRTVEMPYVEGEDKED